MKSKGTPGRIYAYVSPPLEPSHPSHLGKMGSKLTSEPSQSRHKSVTPPVTKRSVEVCGYLFKSSKKGRPSRYLRKLAKSNWAEITPSALPASARIVPCGSTMSERPL